MSVSALTCPCVQMMVTAGTLGLTASVFTLLFACVVFFPPSSVSSWVHSRSFASLGCGGVLLCRVCDFNSYFCVLNCAVSRIAALPQPQPCLTHVAACLPLCVCAVLVCPIASLVRDPSHLCTHNAVPHVQLPPHRISHRRVRVRLHPAPASLFCLCLVCTATVACLPCRPPAPALVFVWLYDVVACCVLWGAKACVRRLWPRLIAPSHASPCDSPV